MKTKSLLFCFVFALCANIHAANAQVNVQDSLALVILYNSTDGPHWNNHTNWLTSSPVKTWYGIKVTNRRVIVISLSGNGLNGRIPSSIGRLANLDTLDLSWNYGYRYGPGLKGPIPSTIGNLLNLQWLDLGVNQLRDSIPSSIGNLLNLKYLNLSFNRQLTGGIPSSISNLVNLNTLNLEADQLGGSIPSSIGKLINLSSFILGYNQLSGSIPSSIGNLVNLSTLDLSLNRLSDSIPSSLGNLVNLHELYLSYNRLSGGIPSSIGNLVNLQELDLHDNRLSGIPSALSNLTNLSLGSPNLRYNYFTFDGLELIVQTLPNTLYDHQKNIPIHQNGNSLSVSAGGTLSNNTYKLLKWEGRTTYVLVATNYGDSVFHPAVSGIYQVKIFNSVVRGIILYSKVIDYTAPNSAVIASAKNALQQFGKANMFRIYPNPAKDMLYVQTNGNASFTLLDQSGKILLTTNISGKGSINVSGIGAGLYYLKNNSTNAVQKVVIAR